jgi:lysophospholipase L1-like esterase
MPFQTMSGDKEEITHSFAGYVNGAYQSSGIVFALELIRLQVFSQAASVYQRVNSGELFTTPSLKLLNRPSPSQGGVTFRSRALLDADLGGNNYALRRGDRLKRLRPDWVTIVLGNDDPDLEPAEDPESEVVGYLYHPGGPNPQKAPVTYEATEVCQWSPIPDPLAQYRGMSWLTPVVREIQADMQATSHKQRFYQNGATPNMVIKHQIADADTMRRWVELFKEQHEGVANAYKTLHLGAGADATVVGNNFQQIDFKAVQGAGETRIAAASGVGAVMAQFSEGLEGSSLNAGNYGASRRRLADTVFPHLWMTFAEAYERIVPVPRNARLWYDDDIQFLTEDALDAANIAQIRANTHRSLLDAGYEPESVKKAVANDDFTQLQHTGLFSVQLQPPGTTAPAEPAADQEPVNA